MPMPTTTDHPREGDAAQKDTAKTGKIKRAQPTSKKRATMSDLWFIHSVAARHSTPKFTSRVEISQIKGALLWLAFDTAALWPDFMGR